MISQYWVVRNIRLLHHWVVTSLREWCSGSAQLHFLGGSKIFCANLWDLIQTCFPIVCFILPAPTLRSSHILGCCHILGSCLILGSWSIYWVAGSSSGEWSLAVGQLQLGPNSGQRSMCTLEQSNTAPHRLSCRPSQGELVLLSGIAPGTSCLVQYQDISCLVQLW